MTADLLDDFIEGPDDIAAFLESLGFRGMTAKRVYRLKEAGGWPIMKLPGMGLTARKSALRDYLRAQEQQQMRGQYGDGQKAPVENKGRRLRSVGR